MPDIGMVIGELAGLFGDRLGDLAATVTDIDAVEPGEAVQQPVAVAVLDEDALAGLDDAVGRLAARMRAHRGRRVKEMVAIPGVEPVPVLQHVGHSSLVSVSSGAKL